MSKITEHNYLPSYDYRGKAFCEKDKHLTSRHGLFSRMDELDCSSSFISVNHTTSQFELSETYYELQPLIKRLLIQFMTSQYGIKTCQVFILLFQRDFRFFCYEFLSSFMDFKCENNDVLIIVYIN